jgi:predicted glycoside hydrolase/deacetylase ChbG (UPF0249 family)
VAGSLRFLIVNADDFGYSVGINRGIAEAHERGIVTSTTLMINAPAVDDALARARDLPRLGIGIHVNFTNEAERLVEFEDDGVCRDELRRQFEAFVRRVGRLPTHIDSHQHVHRHPRRRLIFEAFAREQGLQMRDVPPVVAKGGFFAQWEYGVTDPDKVSVAALSRMIREEVPRGVSEFICHPGYVDPAFAAVYHADRELELATLCDPEVRRVVEEERIELISFAQLRPALAQLAGGAVA